MDYITSKDNVQDLANKIKAYYRNKGHVGVDVWVETIPVYALNGDRLTTRYEIASNIKMKVPSIPQAA